MSKFSQNPSLEIMKLYVIPHAFQHRNALETSSNKNFRDTPAFCIFQVFLQLSSPVTLYRNKEELSEKNLALWERASSSTYNEL